MYKNIVFCIVIFCLVVFFSPSFTVLKINSNSVVAEIADTEHKRERGLMERFDLCENCGMLFVFDQPQKLNFWMKNTIIPLSIAFIGNDGRILNIDEMVPQTLNGHYSVGLAKYALEMTSGWFAKHQVYTGDLVERITGRVSSIEFRP